MNPTKPPAWIQELEGALANLWRQCIDDGLKLPFTTRIVGQNNSVLTLRFDGGRTRILAEHSKDGLFAPPIKVSVADRYGKVVRAVIHPGKITYQ